MAEKSSISVFGLGYVGSVSAAALAVAGHKVIGVDKDILKISLLHEGRPPIGEPGLDQLLSQAIESGRIVFTQDSQEAVLNTDISLICVGTPPGPDGAPDLRDLIRVCEAISLALRRKKGTHTVLVRSTVLPGTTRNIIGPTLERLSGKKVGQDIKLAFHPEFLREVTAVADFNDPRRVVVGWVGPGDDVLIREMYNFLPSQTKFFSVGAEEAECLKYADNAFHGLKVAFINEISRISRESGAEPDTVAEMFLADPLLNTSEAYLRPGFAFGGSCLPKDIKALAYKSKQLQIPAPVVQSILPSNTAHIQWVSQRILSSKPDSIGVYGLSFKQGTDDLRESPVLYLIKQLADGGVRPVVADPEVRPGDLHGRNLHEALAVVPWLLESIVAPEEVFAKDVVVFTKVPKTALPQGIRGFDLTGKLFLEGLIPLP